MTRTASALALALALALAPPPPTRAAEPTPATPAPVAPNPPKRPFDPRIPRVVLPPGPAVAVKGRLPVPPPRGYEGLRIDPNPKLKLTPRSRKVVDAFAAKLTALDPQPPDRLAHFGWVAARGLRVIRWEAHVTTVAGAPDGQSWLLTVHVSPLLFDAKQNPYWTFDSFDEVYQLAPDGTIRLVNTLDPGPAARAQLWPL